MAARSSGSPSVEGAVEVVLHGPGIHLRTAEPPTSVSLPLPVHEVAMADDVDFLRGR
jgi:hypothetical protein